MWDRYNLKGQQLMSAGKHAEAEDHFKLALNEAKGLGPKDPKLSKSFNNLANCLRAQGKYDQAEPLYQEAIKACEQAQGAFHQDLVMILENYATLLRATGRDKEADKHQRRAHGIFTMK